MNLFPTSLVLFGVILPIGALIAECGWHFCASAFFDPVPSIWHVLAVALVPLSNAISMPVIFGESRNRLRLLSTLNTIALCVSIYYSVLFLPLLPLGAIAILLFGLGFFCFAPLLSFVVTIQVRSRLKTLLKESGTRILPLDVCASILLIFAALLGLSANLTRTCEYEIAANKNTAPANLLLLRAFGDRETMLRACYGLSDIASGWAQATVNWRYSPRDYVYLSEELAREIFYRASGKSFNSFKHPPLTPSDRFAFMDDGWYDYYGDHDFAGDVVGGVVRGLKLSKSRIGGEFDPDAAAEHLVWTMNFEKDGYESRELRIQLQLPPSALVSGCWLTVNGQKKDAIFIGRQSARTGYVKQASSGQTGLLVSTSGPGRVLLQAPAINSDLELCVEIDAPMKVLDGDRALLTFPSLVERNFETACKTDVHMVEILRNAREVSEMKSLSESLHLSLDNGELSSGPATAASTSLLEHKRRSDRTEMLAFNPFNQATVAMQKILRQRLDSDRPLLIVIDGSQCMEGLVEQICKQLQDIDMNDLSLVWASDQPALFASHLSGKSGKWQEAVSRLKDSSCVGGQDNAAAISLALQEASLERGVNVLWIHGPQAVKLGSLDLSKLWSSRSKNSTLYEYQAVPGPNELIKSLDRSEGICSVGHSYGLSGDLRLLIEELSGKRDVYSFKRKLIAPAKDSVINGPSFLSRLAASDWIRERLPFRSEDSVNAKVAERYHIVTPLTSAFVKLDVPSPEYQHYNSRLAGSQNQVQESAQKLVPESGMSESSLKASAGAGGKNQDNMKVAQSTSDTSKAEELDPLAGITEDGPEQNMIPTKPEPPLLLLMLCLILVSAPIVLKKCLKAKCV